MIIEEFNSDLLVINVILTGFNDVVKGLHAFSVRYVSGVSGEIEVFWALFGEGLVFVLE